MIASKNATEAEIFIFDFIGRRSRR